ncbi:unnamed protein product [Caenorhabditis angaria]|uniref:Uncharacterized protein n=1 Tax=Caenorhabditis angaria TaxID=860376 RepID=A0A9P1ILJ9_9PELO|nr:unnamed protein product [Caenorhabditis angaria]
MIGMSGLLFLAGILLVVQCVREGLNMDEFYEFQLTLMKKNWSLSNETLYSTNEIPLMTTGKSESSTVKPFNQFKDNIMLPSVFVPFFIAIACLLFAIFSIYYILFPIAILFPINIGLTIWSIVRIIDNIQMIEISLEYCENCVRVLKLFVKEIKKELENQTGFPGTKAGVLEAIELLKKMMGTMNEFIGILTDFKSLNIFHQVVLGVNIFLSVTALGYIAFLIFMHRPCGRKESSNRSREVEDSKTFVSKSLRSPSDTGTKSASIY